jgi:hypothetical protein
MKAMSRRYALIGAVLWGFGCEGMGGLESGRVLGPSGTGGVSGDQPTGTGSFAAPSVSGAGGVTVGSSPAPGAGQSCDMTCFTSDANTIAHWTFDTIENGVVPDQSGNGFDATPFGAPTLTDATCGNAMSLSGNGQYLDVQRWNRLIGYSRVRYDVLFKINSMRNDGTAGSDMLSELINDSHWYPIGGAVVRVRNNVCQFAIASTSGWQHLTDVVPVSLGEWHHVSASFDTTTSTMTLQLDCNAPVSMTYSGTFVPSYVSYIRIASCVVDPPSRFVNGAIDDIIIRGWKSGASDPVPDPTPGPVPLPQSIP